MPIISTELKEKINGGYIEFRHKTAGLFLPVIVWLWIKETVATMHQYDLNEVVLETMHDIVPALLAMDEYQLIGFTIFIINHLVVIDLVQATTNILEDKNFKIGSTRKDIRLLFSLFLMSIELFTTLAEQSQTIN